MSFNRMHFKENWAFYLFFIPAALSSWLRVSLSPQSGHYDIFSDAARFLWAGQNPYGIESMSGYYFYSPSCALFFFSLFSYLPYNLGLSLYMLLSSVVFVAGLRLLFRDFKLDKSLENLCWLFLSSEIIGSLLNAKLEIMICGIGLFVLHGFLQKQVPVWAPVLLAVISNWKFQSLPTAGLCLSVLILLKRDFRSVVTFLLASLFFFFLPYPILGGDLFKQTHEIWQSSLRAYMLQGENWLNFQHLYALLSRNFGIKLSFEQAQVSSALAGLLLLLISSAYAVKTRLLKPSLLFASALGAFFATVFSPLSQSAGFILYTPLLLAVLFQAQESSMLVPQARALRSRKNWIALAIIGWVFVSFFYSDFTPRDLREKIVELAWKPIGTLIMGFALGLAMMREALRPRNP